MNVERWRLLKAVFAEALALAPEARGAFLERRCPEDGEMRAELEALLEGSSSLDGFLEPGGAAELPASIGGFRILDLIGHGGMGIVYRAEQSHPRRVVALKLIRPESMSRQALRRFEYEAQVLARLSHPGIAQIHEAGTVAGPLGAQPYFTMELVEGEPLIEHARRQGLATARRLELFAGICGAVQHAHQKGVIHRDLKPSNILVSAAGEPKILDFGIARPIERGEEGGHGATLATRAGQVVGTLPYMSPEQIGGDPADLDARSDVYSLGVILFELLTGELPHDLARATPGQAIQVLAGEPRKLSDIDRGLRGDLETIVSKALERDPERRYSSASELALEVERYLADEPIAARPPSTVYQLRKFARRNRVLVASVAAIASALVLGTIGTSIGLVRAKRAEREAEVRRQSAERENARAKEVLRVVEDMLLSVDPEHAGSRDVSVFREMLEASERRAAREPAREPVVAGAVHATIGRVYTRLGSYERAGEHLGRALELLRSEDPQPESDIAQVLERLGVLALARGELDEAEARIGEALDMRRRIYGEDSLQAAATTHEHAGVLHARGQYPAAAAELRAARAIVERHLDHPDAPAALAKVDSSLGAALSGMGDYAAAEAHYRQALSRSIEVGGEDSLQVATCAHNLAGVLSKLDRQVEASHWAREALRLRRAAYREPHPAVADAIHRLGRIAERQGDFEAARAGYAEALEMRRGMLDERHPARLENLSDLGNLLLSMGRLSEAEPILRAALDGQRSRADDPNGLSEGARELGELLVKSGRLTEAEPLLVEAVEILEAAPWAPREGMVNALNSLAQWHRVTGALEQAVDLQWAAIEVARSLWGERHSQVAGLLNNMAVILADAGRCEESEACTRDALDILVETRGAGHPDVLVTRNGLALRLHERGQLEQAAAEYERIVNEADAILPPLDVHRGLYRLNLGQVWLDLGRPDRAEAVLRDAHGVLESTLGRAHEHSRRAATQLARILEAGGRHEEAERFRDLAVLAAPAAEGASGPGGDRP